MLEPNSLEPPAGGSTSKPRTTNPLARVSTMALQSLEAISHAGIYPAAAILFVEGQRPTGVYLLREGRVKLAMTSTEGKTILLRVADPGELLGLSPAVSGRTHDFTAETLEICRLNFIHGGDFLRLLQKTPEFSLKVIQQLSRDYSAACSRVRTLGLTRRASEKLAQFLLDWAARGPDNSPEPQISLPLTHEEIAQAVGLTRETVTRTLAEFKHKRLIAVAGPDVVICNRPALQSLTVS